MKILLIDDHISFCQGLIAALSNAGKNYKITFESNTELVPQSLLEKSEFDLLITDIMMPGLGGTELIKYLHKMKIDIPMAVMSAIEDRQRIRELFELGIIGFIPKYYSIEQIVEAIEQCRTGGIHIPMELKAELQSKNISRSEKSPNRVHQMAPKIPLTRRQIEVICLMDRGLTNQQIADKLFISVATVKTHINHLYSILGVKDRVNCLREAKNLRLLRSTLNDIQTTDRNQANTLPA